VLVYRYLTSRSALNAGIASAAKYYAGQTLGPNGGEVRAVHSVAPQAAGRGTIVKGTDHL